MDGVPVGRFRSASRSSMMIWFIGGLAMVAVGFAAWRVPERTVQPVGDRFFCDGSTIVQPELSGGFYAKVICHGSRGDTDVSALTYVTLLVVAYLVGATATYLVLKIVAPKPKTRIQRAVA